MSNDRSIAVKLMTDAAKAVGKERGPQHGDVESSFRMIAELWSTHINHAVKIATGMDPSPEIHITAWDVLQMMVMLKQARAMHGDRTLADHYADAIGYTGLAGMLATNDVPVGIQEAAPDVRQADPAPAVAQAEPTPIPAFLTGDKSKVKSNAA